MVVSLDTFYEDYNNSVHILLSGLDDNTVKQWHVHPELRVNQTHKKLPIYSVFWINNTPKLAIANTGNQIQILNEDKIRIETEESYSSIKKIVFSKCGSKLIYGLENGEVNEFNLETKTYHKLMTLHGNITLLKYLNENLYLIDSTSFPNNKFNNLIVASADNGCLMVFVNNFALKLRSPVTSPRLPTVPVVECFYLNKINKLLEIDEHRIIKLWSIEEASHEVLIGDVIYSETFCNVTMASLSSDQTMLALTMMDCIFEIYNLNYSSNVKITLHWSTTMDSPLRCCTFSYDNKYLAVGGDNGIITVSANVFIFLN